jgi:hypothetical protein
VHSLCLVVGCLAASALLPLLLRLLLPPRLGLALDLVVAVPVVALVVALVGLVALVGGVAVGLQPHPVVDAGRADCINDKKRQKHVLNTRASAWTAAPSAAT